MINNLVVRVSSVSRARLSVVKQYKTLRTNLIIIVKTYSLLCLRNDRIPYYYYYYQLRGPPPRHYRNARTYIYINRRVLE